MSNTILVVDDEPMNLDLAKTVLCSDGHEVIFAQNGEEAILALQNHSIDAILMDVMMPVMDGFEATRRIKADEKTCDIPVVIVTAASDKNSLKTGLSAGANEFLTKPYDIEELKLRIRNMLRLKQKNDALKEMNKNLEALVEKEVSKRMKLEAEREQQLAVLIQQTKMAELGTMMGVIAHQWMQPLTIISLNAQVFPEEVGGGEHEFEVAKKYSKEILEQTDFMTQTINDFRSFYKPSKKKSPFSVLEQAGSIVLLLSSQLSQSDISVEIGGDDTLCCMGYANEFKQVVLNIINNAKDAFEEKNIIDRSITIHAESQGELIVLTITDNAGGIPLGVLATVFDPFVSTKGEKGTGIGLSLAKTIIEENMRGKISVQNVDNGAQFLIKLPNYQN